MTDANSQAVQTILVVEDEVFVRMVISDYLRSCGFRVIEAANADEAVTLFEHHEITIDVVFSDIEMPGSMDGFELAKWVRAHRPTIDVILAGNAPRAANAAADLCESAPLPKPYEPQFAVDRIRRLIAMRDAGKKK